MQYKNHTIQPIEDWNRNQEEKYTRDCKLSSQLGNAPIPSRSVYFFYNEDGEQIKHGVYVVSHTSKSISFLAKTTAGAKQLITNRELFGFAL